MKNTNETTSQSYYLNESDSEETDEDLNWDQTPFAQQGNSKTINKSLKNIPFPVVSFTPITIKYLEWAFNNKKQTVSICGQIKDIYNYKKSKRITLTNGEGWIDLVSVYPDPQFIPPSYEEMEETLKEAKNQMEMWQLTETDEDYLLPSPAQSFIEEQFAILQSKVDQNSELIKSLEKSIASVVTPFNNKIGDVITCIGSLRRYEGYFHIFQNQKWHEFVRIVDKPNEFLSHWNEKYKIIV